MSYDKTHPNYKEIIKKLKESHKGQIAWNKGIPMREESKRRLSESLKGKPSWNKGKSKTGKIPSKEELTKDYLLDKLSREIIRKKYNIL